MKAIDRQHHERGSALLFVVVIMLVLSIVGMALLTTTEENRDETVSTMYSKQALFAAEVGLRRGELILFTAGATAASGLMSHTPTAVTSVVTPVLPQFPQRTWEYDLVHLGTYLTENTTELANQVVPVPAAGGPAPEGFYSLYIRNNIGDGTILDSDASNGTTDTDETVRLISVGWVQFGDRVNAVKIIEEEYTWGSLAEDPSAQKGMNSGNTGAGSFGRG